MDRVHDDGYTSQSSRQSGENAGLGSMRMHHIEAAPPEEVVKLYHSLQIGHGAQFARDVDDRNRYAFGTNLFDPLTGPADRDHFMPFLLEHLDLVPQQEAYGHVCGGDC